MDELPEWIVRDMAADEDSRIHDVRFFAEDGEHAKRQWCELMGLAADDPDVILKAVPIAEYFAFRAILGDALRNQQYDCRARSKMRAPQSSAWNAS